MSKNKEMTEKEFEDLAIKEFQKLDWIYNKNIGTISDLEKNFKEKLEKLNNTKLTKEEFKKIKEELRIGYTDYKSISTRRDNLFTEIYLIDKKNRKKIKFFDFNNVYNNTFEIINQVKNIGKNKNIYDIFLLINGIPVIGIELKRPGVSVEEAFGQIIRYSKDSYKNSLFEIAELFVISNNIVTKFFANNLYHPDFSYKLAYKWKKENGEEYSSFFELIQDFFKKEIILDYLRNYFLYSVDSKDLVKKISLRPYQYYAIKNIKNKVIKWLNNNLPQEEKQKGGVIWHSTGSGKTITSYVATKILSEFNEIEKVICVVDRKDLDTQMTKEYKKFDNDIESTDKTQTLYNKLISKSSKDKIIITTIQKLNKLLNTKKYNLNNNQKIKEGKYVFIFDEAHRSNSGKQHVLIKKVFENSLFFGFTGTPIFKPVNGLKTSKEIFGDIIHKYTMEDAIEDGNVLKLYVEFYDFIPKDIDGNKLEIMKKLKERDLVEINRYKKIINEILKIHDNLTRNRKFNALYTVQNRIAAAINYKLFMEMADKTKLKVGLLYNYHDNEYVEGLKTKYDLETMESINKTAREILDEAILNHDKLFGTNIFNNKNRYSQYTKVVQEKIKNGKYDIVIVANMLLTGFDSPITNTIYIDKSKNTPEHNLFQMVSRPNRIYTLEKVMGNVIFFRDLKEEFHNALKLYATGKTENLANFNSIVLDEKYFQELKNKFKIKYNNFLQKYSSNKNIWELLKGEKKKKEFVKDFSEILTLYNKLNNGIKGFNLDIDYEEFQKFSSIYKEIYSLNRHNNDGFVSILSNMELNLTLIDSIIVDYDYIVSLIKKLQENNDFEKTYNLLIEYLEKKLKYKEQIEIIKSFVEKIINSGKNISSVDLNNELKKYIYQCSEKKLVELIHKYSLNKEKMYKKVEQCIEKRKNEYIKNDKELDKCYISYNEVVDSLITKLPNDISFLEIKKYYEKIMQELNKFLNIYYFYV